MRKNIKHLSLKKNQRGDTLISVIISVGVISLVIVIAYVLVIQGLQLGQQAREREQVRSLVRGQVESLKYLAIEDDEGKIFKEFKLSGTSVDGAPDGFCLGKRNSTTTLPEIKVGVLKLDMNGDIDTNPMHQTSELSQDVDHNQCEELDSLVAANVKIKITYDEEGFGDSSIDGDEDHLFTIIATWDRVSGGGEENMVVPIRIHPLRADPTP